MGQFLHGSATTTAAVRWLRETWQVVDDQIGDSTWVLGSTFSAADIYLFMLTTWLKPERGHPLRDKFPNVKRVTDGVMMRPSVQHVYENWMAEQAATIA